MFTHDGERPSSTNATKSAAERSAGEETTTSVHRPRRHSEIVFEIAALVTAVAGMWSTRTSGSADST